MVFKDINTELNEKLVDYLSSRVKSKNELFKLAEHLDDLHRKSIKSTIINLSIGIAGSSSVLAGLLLAPATFGLSLGLTLFGTAACAVGGIVSIWGSIKEDIYIKKMCKKIENLVNDELKKSNESVVLVSNKQFRRKMQNDIGELVGVCAQESYNIANIALNVVSAKHAGDIANASKILLNPCRPLVAASIGISVVFLGIDIVKLIETTSELEENAGKSPFSDRIRAIAHDLDSNIADFEFILKCMLLKD